MICRQHLHYSCEYAGESVTVDSPPFINSRRILHRDKGLHLTRKLKGNDHRQRLVFSKFALEILANESHFHRKVIFNDEPNS